MSEPINVEATVTPQSQALAVRPSAESQAIGKAMSVQEVAAQLAFIREVMKDVMTEGQDYGKIPGTGDKPSLLQPGAQKLLMTFRLTEEVLKETIVDLPNYHREVRYVVRVCSQTGMHWDGVGTCSTLEAKYRFRKANRRCPSCGKETIIEGKAEYGGGWICWKKKGGCEAKFSSDDQRITSQPGGVVEHDNPADFWNTVQKMSFKRALVHASINATNTSELWTQDVEEMAQNEEIEKERAKASQTSRRAAPSQAQAPRQNANQTPQSASSPPQNAQTPAKPKVATETTRAWFLEELKAKAGEAGCQIVTEYFQKLGQILETESLAELPLHFLPLTRTEMRALKGKLDLFEQGQPAEKAYEPHYPPGMPGQSMAGAMRQAAAPSTATTPQSTATPPSGTATTPASTGKPIEVPRDNPKDPAGYPDDKPYWKVICPIPHKGQKRDEYMKKPDTIGSLYLATKAGDQEAQRRLWGFAHNFEPKGWTNGQGQTFPPSELDGRFRMALDAFLDDHGNQGKEAEDEGPSRGHSDAAPEEDDIPF